MHHFTNQSLLTIIQWLKKELQTHNQLTFTVLNPDISSKYSGELIEVDKQTYIYRGYKAWINLAELHHCKMLTPIAMNEHIVKITFQKLNTQDSFHSVAIENREEKYGTQSKFFNISKNEEPTFLHAYHKALEAVKIEERKQILNLGINKGDEFELIAQMVKSKCFDAMQLVGIDHAQTALEFAKKRFSKENVHFYKHDINKLSTLNLSKSDLIISIGTLQSPGIHYKTFLMSLVQEHLSYDGALILGFPNSRWIDTELIYGAKAPNYSYSEMSLLFNDVIFAKKYLQQKKFRVTITGREYIFLTATRINLT
ncbi:class I SAM-dependent methyltransferase [bacterium]|nr:class I SAM-dependent methyltransferase [bacterium]MBU1958726.1 class I SAM-dependent methyltransferase [bacterium]